MSALFKIIRACRIVPIFAQQPVLTSGVKYRQKSFNVLEPYVGFVNVRNMSQKSITSFFKITPKKAAEVKRELPVENDGGSAGEDSPVKNEKRTSKRQRLDSSGEETATTSPKTNSDMKKKAKRQRIDSSGSESEPKSQGSEDMTVAKSNGPFKTYNSPRSKKKQDSPKEEKSPDTKVKIKEEKTTPAPKKGKKSPTQKTPKTETKRKSVSPVQNGISNGTKEESPLKKVKKEKESPKSDDSKTGKDSKSADRKSGKASKSADSKSGKDSKSADSKSGKDSKSADSKSGKDSKSADSKSGKDSKSADSKSGKDSKTEKGNKVEDKANVNGEKVAETEYNPSKSKYHPINDACWSKGQEVPYLALAKTLEAIEATSARLKMIDILANYFRSVIVLTPEDLLPSVYMCLNQLAPAYHSLELGIAETYLMKAIGQCTGRSLSQVKAAAQKSGDLGLVAEQARNTQRTMFAPPPLTLRKVFAACREVARMTGQASVNKKISKIQSLYVACRHSEARYLIRSFEGKLRIGLAEQSVLQALAVAAAATPPATDGGEQVLDASKGLSQEEFKSRVEAHALLIKTTYCECPDYDRLVPALLQHGVHELPNHCKLEPGTPLKPMLAHPTRGVSEVFDRFEGVQFTCEWKYDGERAQIHVPGGDAPDLEHASVFSRNQENNTTKYPDVLRRLPSLLKASVTSCVLDTEAVAYDVENKQILPFQILSTRKRKDAVEADIKVQVCVFVFDVLFLNGQPLVRRPLAERRALLREHFNEVPGEWQFATSKDCTTMEEVQQFLEESVKGSCEGLMVKMLTGDNARYDIARRSHNWLKLKKDYLEGVGDTIDAVVIGGYRGRGKRAGGFGGFLLACYDPDSEEYQALCKLGTGFSDEDLQTLSAKLEEHIIENPRNYYRYDQSVCPDAWFSPALVWELRCADLSLSPAHRAAVGLLAPDKGVSLRFPRFVRERDDKTPEQATTAQQLADMYLAQDQVKNQAGRRPAGDDFY